MVKLPPRYQDPAHVEEVPWGNRKPLRSYRTEPVPCSEKHLKWFIVVSSGPFHRGSCWFLLDFLFVVLFGSLCSGGSLVLLCPLMESEECPGLAASILSIISAVDSVELKCSLSFPSVLFFPLSSLFLPPFFPSSTSPVLEDQITAAGSVVRWRRTSSGFTFPALLCLPSFPPPVGLETEWLSQEGKHCCSSSSCSLLQQ